ncbi:SDR family oxidoreductase [Hoeflea sp. YIM 152468]|uniref:SDR family NAD(P)-dependent oxidoreductase n=1 Tax=Hoeflea sp. YIM 152468 TaxID=3031759 RepID=UPI0023DC9AE0|nr:SDR family oxidoreductase [Hoeflea sp. YIM 152468]MDF1610514.1 SDR family oxidoreductase [Hoeflea sp. YIM 152468]
MRLDGRTAIVTGGAKGIGLAVVRRLASEGARVMIADVDEAAGAAAVESASGDGEVLFTATDVAGRLDVHNLVAKTIDAFGSINALVNNAGIVHAADFLDLEEADFDRVLAVNLKSAFLCGQAVARHMVEQIAAGEAPGSIVNMSSINDTFAIANQVAYSVSKGGVSQLTRAMALSLAPHGIRVNAVGPGSIMTDMLASVADNPEIRTRILSRTPLGRIGDPSEIAAVTAFLLSEDASYVTGQTIYADGGRMPLNYTVPVKE